MSDDSREVISNILNWDEELQTFLQSKGTKDLDASVPLMPLIRFISPVDSMWRSTVKVIEARLVEDTLIRRYEAERTHVAGGEVASLRAHFGTSNTFSACRELEKPQLLFEKLLGFANHLGLYSEIGPSGQHLGNFPRACKHLALISTATYGLNDSSSGLAARIVEKSRAWSDCGGDIESRFAQDELLTHKKRGMTNVGLYVAPRISNSDFPECDA